MQDADRRPLLVGFFRASGQINASEQASRIQVPTLVIASDADEAVPMAMSRSLAALVPGVRFGVVEGASHVGASLMDPRVMRLVSDFLAEDRASAP